MVIVIILNNYWIIFFFFFRLFPFQIISIIKYYFRYLILDNSAKWKFTGIKGADPPDDSELTVKHYGKMNKFSVAK